MTLKKGQTVTIKREQLEEMQDETKVMFKCSRCGKIHTSYEEDDHYIDEWGCIVCADCIEKDEWSYTFDFDYNNQGNRIYTAYGTKWDSNRGEYIHDYKIFEKLIAI